MQTQLDIHDTICWQGKISINLEKHGDEDVLVFAIPITRAMVESDTACAIAGDEHFTRSIYNDNKGFLEPMTWHNSPIPRPEKYEGAVVTIRGAHSDEELRFEDAKVQGITLQGTPGGLTEFSGQVQVKPGLDRTNLLLQEYQNHEIRISIAEAKVALKKSSKQGTLALVGGGSNSAEPSEQQAPSGPTQQENDDETQRQLGEALRGLEKPQQGEAA